LCLTVGLCSRAGLDEEELKAEQGIILTQLAYLKQLQGDAETASKLYSDVLSQEYTSMTSALINRGIDSATRAIALENQLILEPRSNPFENYRIHTTAQQAILSSKPFSTQARLFSSNSLLFASQAHKSISAATTKHLQSHPLDYSASVIRIRNELPDSSDPAFVNRLTALYYQDEKDVGAALLLVQHHAAKGNTHLATSVLEKLSHALKDNHDVKYAPGLVSLAVLLYPKDDKDDKATSLLLEAKRHWQNKGSTVFL
jgi:signal recognition particle subunit SRP72